MLLFLALASLAPAQQGPTFLFTYVLASTQNVVALKPGDTIAFSPTALNGIAQAAFDISNVSNLAGQIAGVTVSGAAFTVSGLPLFPYTIPSGQTLQLLISYQPTGQTTDTGQIVVTFPGGATVTFGLKGSASAAKLVYTLIQGTQTTPILPGTNIPLPDTNVGSTSTVVIQVKNTGNLNATVSALILNGVDFSITGAPALPTVVQPGGSFSFSIVFAPTEAVNRQASLSVGFDSFSLTGKGLGPRLVFSYASGGSTVTLGPTDGVVFTPIMVSQSGQVTFTVQNLGTVATTVFNIGIGESPSPFSVSGLPALPLSLAANAQSSFTITFAPTTTGFVNGTLRLNSTVVILIGSGTAPPPLPAYTIEGASGTVAPGTQINVDLKLSKPYPVALVGTLVLTVASSLPADPAVQFSTGGHQALFTIGANETLATFAGQGQQIQLQTGTVASTITLTPTFATQAGGVNLTPSQPTSLQLTVPDAAPTLTAVLLAAPAGNAITVSATGFTSSRSLTGISVQFTGAPGFNVPSTPFNIDLSQAAPLWFNTIGSDAFGGGFNVSVPFVLSGKVSSGQTLLQSISAVAVTVTNATGTSSTLKTTVP